MNPSDEFAYSCWAEVEAAGVAAHRVPLEDDRVVMLHPTERPAFYTPLTITCGAKQVQTCLEPTTFEPQGRTLWHHAHTQAGDPSLAVPVALDSDLVLQPFERTVVKAKVITTELERNVERSYRGRLAA